MQLSRYLQIWPCPDRPGHVILYSTRKGSVVRLPEDCLEAIRQGNLSGKEAEALRRLEILVDDLEAERASMTEQVSRTNSRSTKFTAKIVLNLDCNLDCPYCFEGNFRKKQYMSSETSRQLIDYVVREQIGRERDVILGFYGGEPLLSKAVMKEIAGRLQKAAGEKGVKFSFYMTTNATLLTKQVVKELLPLGLTRAIVTLDGPREIHDLQRPFISGKGSFDIILANIKAVYELIEIVPGGNYYRENYREFPRMLDHLLEDGISPERLGRVEFAPIMPKAGKVEVHDVNAGCVSCNEPWVTESALFLREEILKRGFATGKPTMAACQIEFENDLVVNYDGSLYKCPVFMGWPEMSVGTLTDGIKDYRQSHNMDVWKNDECLDCAYLPLCFGGCRMFSLMRNGSIDGVDCRKGYYDATLKELVLQDLRYPPSARKGGD